jgi:hypothetical protein
MRTCWVANDSEVSDRHPRPCTICFSNILTLGEGWSVLTVGYVGDVGQLSWTNNRFFFALRGLVVVRESRSITPGQAAGGCSFTNQVVSAPSSVPVACACAGGMAVRACRHGRILVHGLFACVVALLSVFAEG